MSGSSIAVLVDTEGRFALEMDDMLRRHYRDQEQAMRHHARAKAKLEELLPKHLSKAGVAFEQAASEAEELCEYTPAQWPADWEQVDDDAPNPHNPPRSTGEGPITLRFFLAQVAGGSLAMLLSFHPVPAKRRLEALSKALRQSF